MTIRLLDVVSTPNGPAVVLGLLKLRGQLTELIVSHDPGRLAEGRPEQNPELTWSYPIGEVEVND